jgi:predicted amidohydrolase
MTDASLRVAIIHEVFHGSEHRERLRERLAQAQDAGAALALLPELPLHRWVPATRNPQDDDAEPPGGERHRLMAETAREIGIGIHGGTIVREPSTGRRFNRALLFDATGELIAQYDKLHVPCEPGFWEADHYEPGELLPTRVDAFGLPLGMQICSDMQRPTISNLLGAKGAELILAPRATPAQSYERWSLVLRADAVTSAAYVISVNRPEPEGDAPIGGSSVVIAPDGAVLQETSDPVTPVTLERSAVAAARDDYPGYLAVRTGLYARGWDEVESPGG